MEDISVKEAAQILPGGAVSEQYIRALIKQGKIKAVKFSKVWKVDKASVLAFRPEKSTRSRRGGYRF